MLYNIDDIKLYMNHFEFNVKDGFMEDDIYSFFEALDETSEIFNYAVGATKCVIIPEKKDYVIKLPFTAIMHFNDEDEEEELLYFKNASLLNKGAASWDYCEAETELYDYVTSQGYGNLFLPIEKINEITNYPTYIQSKIKMSCQYEPSKNRDKEVIEQISQYMFLNQIRNSCKNWWYDVFTDCFNNNKTDFKDFLHFLSKNGLDEDLHAKNVGYLNNKPIIVDYAGFSEYE